MTYCSCSAILCGMKKLVQTLLIFSVVLGSFLAPVEINTETLQPVVSEVYAANNDFSNSTISAICSGSFWDDISCEIGNFFLWYFELIWYKTTQVVAFIVAFGVDLLLFHSISSATYRTGIIEAGWEILRNLVNIIFIFSLLTIAFQMVFGAASSKTKETLIKTIVVALVINFSLFVTYLVIDASNILANVFYSRIETEDSTPGNLGTNGTQDSLKEFFGGQTFTSPSSAIVNNFQPQAIVTSLASNANFFERWLVIFAAGGLNILMVILFSSIILLFLGRTVGLIFSAIFAPIAFATLTIPFGSATSLPYIGFNTWLKQLVSLAFMGPAYLFFLFLIITFSNNKALFNSIILEPGAGVLPSILAVFIPFALVATLLYTAKKVTEKMAGELGGQIANGVTKVAQGAVAAGALAATGGALAVAGGATALGGVSRVAGGVLKSKKMQSFGKLLQTTKFDVSKIPGFNSTIGKSKIANKIAGGLNTSYADADTRARAGLNNLRGRADHFFTKTPEAVAEWDKNLKESRVNLDEKRKENKERDDLKKTKIDSKDKSKQVLDTYNTSNGEIEASGEMDGMSLQDALDKKLRDRARRGPEATFKAKKKIEESQKEVQLDIDAKLDEIKNLNDEAKSEINRLNEEKKEATTTIEKDAIGKEINSKRTETAREVRKVRVGVEELKKKKSDIEKTSLEGQIKQIENIIENQKAESRSQLLEDDTSNRTISQDSNMIFTNKEKRKERIDALATSEGEKMGAQKDT